MSWFYRPSGRFPAAAGGGAPPPAVGDVIGYIDGAPARDLGDGRAAAGRVGVRQPIWILQSACAELRLGGYE